ncbi:hypothetical protein BP6252_12653 [Coleophoma cylindrospora]|uniref:Uncharacterized protein n=1 Tax=Coleophoma cylindrospora TaxID=1849047 RepID=A0A3D8QCI6_9HELO|nr:hypothetical protein BP6252_12653 [Coleophoma cylindrospora]
MIKIPSGPAQDRNVRRLICGEQKSRAAGGNGELGDDGSRGQRSPAVSRRELEESEEKRGLEMFELPCPTPAEAWRLIAAYPSIRSSFPNILEALATPSITHLKLDKKARPRYQQGLSLRRLEESNIGPAAWESFRAAQRKVSISLPLELWASDTAKASWLHRPGHAMVRCKAMHRTSLSDVSFAGDRDDEGEDTPTSATWRRAESSLVMVPALCPCTGTDQFELTFAATPDRMYMQLEPCVADVKDLGNRTPLRVASSAGGQ